MRLKNFLIALPLNFFFAAGMLYLRDVKGAMVMISLGIIVQLSLWPVYFLILIERDAMGVFAVVWFYAVLLVSVALTIALTWISAKKRTQRKELGFKRSLLVFMTIVCGYTASQFLSPRYAPTYSVDVGWSLGWIEPFHMQFASMLPSVNVGDYLWATKIKSSRSLVAGDIVVFRQPRNEKDVMFVQRIIGIPGDQLEIRKGLLHLNGVAVERSLQFQGTSKIGQNFTDYLERLPGGTSYLIREMSDNSSLDNTYGYTVPDGHYFMLGDNRDNSADSRISSVGFVPFENIDWEVRSIFFSHEGTASIWEISKWLQAVRWDRMGLMVQ